MVSIRLQIFCSIAVTLVLSGAVSSQYGPPPKAPSPQYGAPGIPQASGGGYGGAPPPAPSPGGKPAPAAGGGGGQEGSEPEPFNFNYQVKDEVTGTDFGHKADSDGKTVQGQYNVALPDGRKQIVTYIADEKGYKADVKYEGVAIPGPSGPAPAPAPAARPASAPKPAAPSAGYPAPPSGGFKPPPASAPSGPGGANGNFPSGYPSGGGAGPVKGNGGFGGYRRK